MLLLNQSYEPLSICNVKKAICLVILDKAELVAERNNRKLHSVKKTFPWPSVIRLNRYVKRPFKKIILSRKNILKRDGHKCGYCGRGDLQLTLDHINPKAKGGTDTWENLVVACLPCNNKKGNRTLKESGYKLRVKPYAPTHVTYIRTAVSQLDDNWKPYLFH